jgi:hypothetical protein
VMLRHPDRQVRGGVASLDEDERWQDGENRAKVENLQKAFEDMVQACETHYCLAIRDTLWNAYSGSLVVGELIASLEEDRTLEGLRDYFAGLRKGGKSSSPSTLVSPADPSLLFEIRDPGLLFNVILDAYTALTLCPDNSLVMEVYKRHILPVENYFLRHFTAEDSRHLSDSINSSLAGVRNAQSLAAARESLEKQAGLGEALPFEPTSFFPLAVDQLQTDNNILPNMWDKPDSGFVVQVLNAWNHIRQEYFPLKEVATRELVFHYVSYKLQSTALRTRGLKLKTEMEQWVHYTARVAFPEVRKKPRAKIIIDPELAFIGSGAFKALGCLISAASIEKEFLSKEPAELDWGDWAGLVNNLAYLAGAAKNPLETFFSSVSDQLKKRFKLPGIDLFPLLEWVELASNAGQILSHAWEDYQEGYYGRASLRTISVLAQFTDLTKKSLKLAETLPIRNGAIQRMSSRLAAKLIGRIGIRFTSMAGWIYTGVEAYIWLSKNADRSVRPILDGMWEAMDDSNETLRRRMVLKFNPALSRVQEAEYPIPGLASTFGSHYHAIRKNLKADLWPIQPQSGYPHFKMRGWKEEDLLRMFKVNPMELERINRKYQEIESRGLGELKGAELRWFLGVHLLP